MIWKPHVTVAAIVEQENRFLFVEEEALGQIVINQPAGHLEEGEDLVDAVIRETQEETAWDFEPTAVVGIYLWQHPEELMTFLRVSFTGNCSQHNPDQLLDTGIIQALWLSRDELISQNKRLRSPLVLECVDDYLAGTRYPLTILKSLLPQNQ